MEPTYLPRLTQLMRANGFPESEIVDCIKRLTDGRKSRAAQKHCREKIASAAMAGMLAAGPMAYIHTDVTGMAVAWADDLITELDK